MVVPITLSRIVTFSLVVWSPAALSVWVVSVPAVAVAVLVILPVSVLAYFLIVLSRILIYVVPVSVMVASFFLVLFVMTWPVPVFLSTLSSVVLDRVLHRVLHRVLICFLLWWFVVVSRRRLKGALQVALILYDFKAFDRVGCGDIGLTAEVVEGVADRLSGIFIDIDMSASRPFFSYPSQLEGILRITRSLCRV